ncbi:MAG: alpha/beta fold hydrolase [Jatrophihabitans sp.]|nr:MAG: alpha/beta fold hydrolase [Jatrophihabitans sp.]
MWAPCLGPLVERFRVIRVELPGHDGSVTAPRATPCTLGDLADRVLAVLDQAGVGRAHVAGVSIGAMTALWLAARHPARVGRIAALCTTAHPDPERYRSRAAAVRDRGVAAVADVPRALWITPALAERDPALPAALEAMQAGVDPEGYAQCCDALATTDLRPELARVAAPALVVAGADDPAAPPDQLREIADGIAGARLVLLDHAAHLAPVERPGAVARLLLDHLAAPGTPAAGDVTRRAVLGDAHVDAAAAATTGFTAAFQDFITRYAWGEVWPRPGLGRRERSIATLAVLVTLGAEHELALHVRGALRNGLTPDEIGEVLLHTALYAGLPRANRAFAIAREVLAEMPD